MKVNKSTAVEFLVDLGFDKAPDWDNETLSKRLALVPEKIPADEVSDKYKDLYKNIKDANGTLELVDDTPKDKKGDKEAKSEKAEEKGKGKKEKAEKPAKAKKEKKPKKEKKQREVDAYGAGVGTIRAKVNATFTKDWKSFEDIQKEAGVKLRQARIRLRRAVRDKVLEVRRLVEYRLVDKKK